MKSTKVDTTKESFISNETSTPMQAQSTSDVEQLNTDYVDKNETTISGWVCNGTICENVPDLKNSDYIETEVEVSLSDEVVMALEERTGWVCNGTTCTDFGPRYNRIQQDTPSDGNNKCYSNEKIVPWRT